MPNLIATSWTCYQHFCVLSHDLSVSKPIDMQTMCHDLVNIFHKNTFDPYFILRSVVLKTTPNPPRGTFWKNSALLVGVKITTWQEVQAVSAEYERSMKMHGAFWRSGHVSKSALDSGRFLARVPMGLLMGDFWDAGCSKLTRPFPIVYVMRTILRTMGKNG